jgi:hypothetical protein
VLLVDETSLRRPRRCVTVLLNGETGEALGSSTAMSPISTQVAK